MGFELGQRVADYEIVSLLGVGGMSRVFLARHRELATPAIIKTLLDGGANRLGKRFRHGFLERRAQLVGNRQPLRRSIDQRIAVDEFGMMVNSTPSR